MPCGSLAHINYWEGSADLPVVVPAKAGGYPSWQGGVIAGSLFGGLQGLYERARWLVAWARRWWRLSAAQRRFLDTHVEAFAALNGEQQAVVATVLRTVTDPAYGAARGAVQVTATTLGFNKPQAWVKLSHTLKERSDWAENAWRHLDAMRQVDALFPHLTNPQKNLLVELAYVGYAANPRGALTRGH